MQKRFQKCSNVFKYYHSIAKDYNTNHCYGLAIKDVLMSPDGLSIAICLSLLSNGSVFSNEYRLITQYPFFVGDVPQ